MTSITIRVSSSLGNLEIEMDMDAPLSGDGGPVGQQRYIDMLLADATAAVRRAYAIRPA